MAIQKSMFDAWLCHYEYARTFGSGITRMHWRFWFDPNPAARELRAFVNSLTGDELTLVQRGQILRIQAKLRLKSDDLNDLLLRINTKTHQRAALKNSDAYLEKSPDQKLCELNNIQPIAIQKIKDHCKIYFFNGGYEAQLMAKLDQYVADHNAKRVEHSVENLQQAVEVFSLAAHIEVAAESMLEKPITVMLLKNWYTTVAHEKIVGYDFNAWQKWFAMRELRALVYSLRSSAKTLNLQQLGELIVIVSKLGLSPINIEGLINMMTPQIPTTIPVDTHVYSASALSPQLAANSERRDAIIAYYDTEGSALYPNTLTCLLTETQNIAPDAIASYLEEKNAALMQQKQRERAAATKLNASSLPNHDNSTSVQATTVVVTQRTSFDIGEGSAACTSIPAGGMVNRLSSLTQYGVSTMGQWGASAYQYTSAAAYAAGESLSSAATVAATVAGEQVKSVSHPYFSLWNRK